LSDPHGQRPYVNIPIEFWKYGWLLELSPVAIAVMFSLREHLGGSQSTGSPREASTPTTDYAIATG
jgi:hypothetical protein